MINVQECSIGELGSILPIAYNMRQPVMIWGPPGVGKSQKIAQFTREQEMSLIDVRLTTLESVDLRGLPWPDKDKQETVWMRPEFFPTSNEPGVVFIDEITAAEPRLQASSYELVLDRRIGKHKLPDAWWVVAAGNGTEDGAVSYGMSSALADRFMHIKVRATAPDWIQWAKYNNIHPGVITFIKIKPEMLASAHGQENVDHLVEPTPRSWERVSNVLYATENWDVRSIMLNGLIGDSVTVEFKHTIEELEQLPPIEDLLKMKPEQGAKKIPTTISALYGLSYSLAGYCTEVKDFDAATKLMIAVANIKDKLPRREIQGYTMEMIFEKASKKGKLKAFMATDGFKAYQPNISNVNI